MKHLLHFKTLFAVMLMLFCVNGVWAQNYEKVTAADQLVAGSKYIIVNEVKSVAMGAQNDNNRGQVAITITENTISSIDASVAVLTLGGSEGAWTFNDGTGYLYAASSKKNYLRTHSNVDANSQATISISASGDATIKFVGSYTRNSLKYNSSNSLFSCYSSGQNPVQLYVEKSGDPSKQDQPLSFGETTTFEAFVGASFAAPTLTGAMTAVTYESENPKVATVDAKSGAVTLVGVGTTTITANAVADATYNAASVSYTLTVKAKPVAPKTVQNIAEFLTKKVDDKIVYTFANSVVVVKQYKSDLWIKDETGYLNVHGNVNQTYNLGDEIPAGFSGVHSIYKEVHQVSSPTGFQTASQTGLEVLPIEMKVGEITTVDINKYVILKGVKFSKTSTEIIDGTNSIAYYDKFKLNNFPTDGNQYDVVAIVNHHNSLQVLPISYTKVQNDKQNQTLSFSAAEYNATMGVAFDSPKVTGNKTTVTYFSDNTKVATVDANTGVVTLVGEGDATITATAEVTTDYNGASASYVLHVAKGEVKGEALPYRQVGGSKDLSENFTNEGLDKKDYDAAEAKLKFVKTGANLTMKLAEAPASLSYFVRWNTNNISSGTFGNFVVETSVDGKVYEELTAYTNASFANGQDMGAYFTLNENVRYIRWTYVEKVDGNIGLGSIFVSKKGDATAYPVQMSTVKHATFFADEAVVVPAGLTANYATVNGETIRLTSAYNAGDVLPANTPVVLTGEAADYELGKTIASTTKAKGANDLRGALTDEVINAQANEKFYILANDAVKGLGFYFQGKGTDGSAVHGLANKAYLVATGDAATVKGFAFEGEATGIEGIEAEKANEAIYTISGVRVNADKNNLPKGLYIIGGKKVLVK